MQIFVKTYSFGLAFTWSIAEFCQDFNKQDEDWRILMWGYVEGVGRKGEP